MADQQTYKEKHEEFVSNLNGTSALEIAFASTIGPQAVFLNVLMTTWFKIKPGSVGLPRFFIDFLTLIIPVELSLTMLADRLDMLFTALLSVSIGVLIISDKIQITKTQHKNKVNLMDQNVEGKGPFISNYRALMMVVTCISILAVDFKIFPRRFAKAETYGTGVMDAGVGSFVFSNAIVSAEARGKWTKLSGIKARCVCILKVVMSCSPLLVLGFARFLAVKSTDYQTHVSEYGVHWNFFFTLAVVKILSTVILTVLSPGLSGVLAVALGISYQYTLQQYGLQEFLLLGSNGHGSREGLLDANREGIISCWGYTAIYFAGVQLGQLLFKHRSRVREWVVALAALCLVSSVFWVLLILTEELVDQVSRRMCNLAYIVWTILYNVQILASLLFVDLLIIVFCSTGLLSSTGSKLFGSFQCILLDAINRNALLFFLLANLFTGIVNMSMQTIHASSMTGFTVLTGYLLALSVIIYTLHVKGINTKIW